MILYPRQNQSQVRLSPGIVCDSGVGANQIQVARDVNFTEIVWTGISDSLGPIGQIHPDYRTSGLDKLDEHQVYWVRHRYTGDPWSPGVMFTTRGKGDWGGMILNGMTPPVFLICRDELLQDFDEIIEWSGLNGGTFDRVILADNFYSEFSMQIQDTSTTAAQGATLSLSQGSLLNRRFIFCIYFRGQTTATFVIKSGSIIRDIVFVNSINQWNQVLLDTGIIGTTGSLTLEMYPGRANVSAMMAQINIGRVVCREVTKELHIGFPSGMNELHRKDVESTYRLIDGFNREVANGVWTDYEMFYQFMTVNQEQTRRWISEEENVLFIPHQGIDVFTFMDWDGDYPVLLAGNKEVGYRGSVKIKGRDKYPFIPAIKELY